MLISLLALLVMAVSSGIRATLGDDPIALEGPSTLELGLIGGGIVAAYAVATRAIWRRKKASIQSGGVSDQWAHTGRLTTAAKSEPAEKPSRGAA